MCQYHLDLDVLWMQWHICWHWHWMDMRWWGYERLVTLMFDGYNEGWWLPALRQEVESTRGVLHIFLLTLVVSCWCLAILVMALFCISFWLFAWRCSLAVAVGRWLVFGFDADCLIFLVLYVIDRWLVKSTKGAPHILFHFHCSSSSSTFFSAFSFLSWSWSLSPHFKIGRVAHTNSDLWTLISML